MQEDNSIRIERITDISDVLECIPFEQEIRNKGRDTTRISKMILFIKDQLPNPMFGYWIAYNDDKIVGYTVAMLSLVPSMERLIVLRMYAKERDLQKQFQEILTTWAKEFKIKTASITVVNDSIAKALERIDGWKPMSINLERRI
jgi:hypothetical protein